MYSMKNTLVSIHPLLLKLAHRMQKAEMQFLVKCAPRVFHSEVNLEKGSEAKVTESWKEGAVSLCAARGYKNQWHSCRCFLPQSEHHSHTYL